MIKTPVHAATDGLDDDDNVIYIMNLFINSIFHN